MVSGALTVANMLLVYFSFAYFVELRKVNEFAINHMWRELAIGLLLGFLLMTACVLIAMALGIYHVDGTQDWYNLIPTGVSLSLPFFEEMVFRGLVFRILEEKLGSWMGLVLSSLLFAGAHLVNGGENLAGITAIAFVYGPMLTAPFILTRRLWMSIGFHGAWNYTMGKVYSVSISGVGTQGLILSRFEGPVLLRGGTAGMEGSLIGILAGITATGIMLTLAVMRGNIMSPPWQQKNG
jgi:membrane protease YdiL (CAAX protease family)